MLLYARRTCHFYFIKKKKKKIIIPNLVQLLSAVVCAKNLSFLFFTEDKNKFLTWLWSGRISKFHAILRANIFILNSFGRPDPTSRELALGARGSSLLRAGSRLIIPIDNSL